MQFKVQTGNKFKKYATHEKRQILVSLLETAVPNAFCKTKVPAAAHSKKRHACSEIYFKSCYRQLRRPWRKYDTEAHDWEINLEFNGKWKICNVIVGNSLFQWSRTRWEIELHKTLGCLVRISRSKNQETEVGVC